MSARIEATSGNTYSRSWGVQRITRYAYRNYGASYRTTHGDFYGLVSFAIRMLGTLQASPMLPDAIFRIKVGLWVALRDRLSVRILRGFKLLRDIPSEGPTDKMLDPLRGSVKVVKRQVKVLRQIPLP